METDLNNNNIAVNSATNKSAKLNKNQTQKRSVLPVNGESKSGRDAVMGLPNENALVELMEQTGYPITVKVRILTFWILFLV